MFTQTSPPPQKKKKKMLQELNTEKSAKLTANYLAGPLSQSINNSVKKGYFPKKQRLPQLFP